jgi:hypothetical protein
MLNILIALYKNTNLILKNARISTNTGVLQGASSSGHLFVLYLDAMVRMMKNRYPADGFLGNLNMLLFMDDTVLLATSRNKLVDKFNVVLDYCDSYGMSINQSKTKFMVINGTDDDKNTIHCRSMDILYTDTYIYLGSPITDDGKSSTSITRQATSSAKHLNKLIAFLDKNKDIPFMYKKAVTDACFLTAITYASETWLGGQLKPLEALYNRALKCLLGVRTTTCTDICLLELNYPCLGKFIQKRQRDYLQRTIPHLDPDDPLKRAMDLCEAANTQGYRIITKIQNMITDPAQEDLLARIETLVAKSASSSKRLYYLNINPQGELHPVYSLTRDYVPEHLRIAFSRLRLVSHNLKIETDRWSRIERAQRTCSCNMELIQDEHHALFECSKTQAIRDTNGYISFQDLFKTQDYVKMCQFVYDAFKTLEN